MEAYETLKIIQKNPNSSIFHLYISGPSFHNALSRNFFSEFPKALSALDLNSNVSAIIIAGNGNHFCTGIDVNALGSIKERSQSGDHGRSSEQLRRTIRQMQDALTAIEKCRKPVIASIHGGCIGAGVDMVTACDLRYCTDDAFFTVKEVNLGITADLGTLQRLPSIVGYGHAMELALTARKVSASEAKSIGLVSRIFGSRDAMDAGVMIIAEEIAGKPPLAVIGTKAVLQKNRDMSVDESLDFVATLNSATLLSNDVNEAISAQMQKRKPIFPKL